MGATDGPDGAAVGDTVGAVGSSVGVAEVGDVDGILVGLRLDGAVGCGVGECVKSIIGKSTNPFPVNATVSISHTSSTPSPVTSPTPATKHPPPASSDGCGSLCCIAFSVINVRFLW